MVATIACDVIPNGYLSHEKEFLGILPKYAEARTSAQVRGLSFADRQSRRKYEDTMFKVLMAKITNMKMALTHPVLVGKGEWGTFERVERVMLQVLPDADPCTCAHFTQVGRPPFSGAHGVLYRSKSFVRSATPQPVGWR